MLLSHCCLCFTVTRNSNLEVSQSTTGFSLNILDMGGGGGGVVPPYEKTSSGDKVLMGGLMRGDLTLIDYIIN